MNIIGDKCHNGIRGLVLLITLMYSYGCVASKDVTDRDDCRGGYARGASYMLTCDVAINEYGTLSHATAVVENSRTIVSRKKGIVSAGTVLELKLVKYYRHLENGTYLIPLAVVKTGRWKGRLVDLSYLSRDVPVENKDPRLPSVLEPDTKYLKAIGTPNGDAIK